MTEIKFRVWQLKWDDYLESWKKYHPKMDYDYSVSSDNIETTRVNNCFLEKDVVFMQFTGIKDIAGREIYEGDIVTVRDNSLHWSDVIEVKRSDEHSGFCLDWYSSVMYEYLEYKVLGNIYETPEFLDVA